MNEILCVDIEATCWEGEPPAGEHSEIIEIGWNHLAYNDEWRTGYSGRSLVRPQYSFVSEYCTDLTGLTQKELDDDGMLFVDALRLVANVLEKPRKTVWASWGIYDLTMLKAQSKAHFPLSHLHLNVKALFSTIYRCKSKGVSGALKHLGWKFSGTPHRGRDDAVNVARILAHILNNGGE